MIISKYTDFLFLVCYFTSYEALFRVLDKRYLGKPLKNRPILHLCALKLRMEPLLFADTRHAVPAFRENAPEWAFHMRSGKRSKKEKRCKKLGKKPLTTLLERVILFLQL